MLENPTILLDIYMPNQIFKESVPNDIFFSFLDTICYQKTDKYYIVDKSSYKKSEFTKDLERFCQIIKPYYHISKINYIERTIHYTNFLKIWSKTKNRLDFTDNFLF